MSTSSSKFAAAIVAALTLLSAGPGCGGTGTGNPNSPTNGGNVALQSAPLAGPNAASLDRSPLLSPVLSLIHLLEPRTWATVSSFSKFSACNDTLVFIDGSGNQLDVNGTSTPSVGQGLLTFSPTATTPMSIGSLNIPAGTTISEIDITFAVVPSICSGATYAVEFNDGTDGTKDITQNTAFKFKFPSGSPLTVTGSSQSATLKFGDIVNGMVSLGSSLDNNTIQTVNVGQAQ